LAVRLLAPDRPLSVGVIGAGAQARYQLRAISQVREIKELRAWSPIPEEVAAYAEEVASTLGVPVSGASRPKEAVEGADLVVTVTPSREPLLELGWLAKGATVVAVGADGPGKQELAAGILGASSPRKTPTRSWGRFSSECARAGRATSSLFVI